MVIPKHFPQLSQYNSIVIKQLSISMNERQTNSNFGNLLPAGPVLLMLVVLPFATDEQIGADAQHYCTYIHKVPHTVVTTTYVLIVYYL